MSLQPKSSQDCRYCDMPARLSLVWADGYIPVCVPHEGIARAVLRKAGAGVKDLVSVDVAPNTYREVEDPILALARREPDENSNFGLRGRGVRKQSALAEAPLEGVQPTTDQGAYLKPFKTPKVPKSTIGKGPESFMRALGTDWKNMRVTRVHDNRLNVQLDSQRYTLYTRRG